MSRSGLKNYYFNEHKKFPVEYIIIPILVIAAIYGANVGWKAWQASRAPELAAKQIMAALQKKDYAALEQSVQLSDDERQRMQFGVTARTLIEQSLSKVEQYGFKIVSFTIGKASTDRNKAEVPIELKYVTRYVSTPKSYDFRLPLVWDEGHWMTTTDAMRGLVPSMSFY